MMRGASSGGLPLSVSSSRLWKRELQRFADETGLGVTVAHLPPGTSKWNRIEHRLFAYISQNWRGKPLVSHHVIIQLIGATTTNSGLTVTCDIDQSRYPKGVKVSDAPPREAMTDSERESLDIIFEMNLVHSKRQTDTAYQNSQAETPSPNGKKSPIPPDWEPDADGIAFAKECHPDICVYEEVQKFRDHYLGTGGQKVDWDAAWRSWCWKYERFECR
jgi:hypothetical protein